MSKVNLDQRSKKIIQANVGCQEGPAVYLDAQAETEKQIIIQDIFGNQVTMSRDQFSVLYGCAGVYLRNNQVFI